MDGLRLDHEGALAFLRAGELEPLGRLVTASNVTLLCSIALDDPERERVLETTCVYKPVRGEAPLWDFPDGTLANREAAAFAVSEATGWDVVPPTILREGPFGPGMVQLWMEIDESVDVVELIRSDDERLRRIALFDAVVNNADRKAGHLLPMPDGRIHGVDHGVCFAADPKLRTVLWGWVGEPFSDEERASLRSLAADLEGELGRSLGALLAPAEIAATRRRLARLIATDRFPEPDPDWPAVPWPWY